MDFIETSKKKRLINFIVDLCTIFILIEITVQVEGLLAKNNPMKILRMVIVFGGYYIPMEYFLGRTLGKYVTGSMVVNRDGTRISFRTAVIRYLCRWIPFEYLSLALGHDAKAWHDVLSKTYVIQLNQEPLKNDH